MSLWQELKRRHVFKVATAYLAVAWLVIQVVSSLNDPLSLPKGFTTIVVVLLGVGFPIALIIAWAFELTPQGIKRTDPNDTRGGVQPGHTLNYFIMGALALAVAFLFVDRFMPGAASEASDAPPSTARATAPRPGSASPRVNDRVRMAVLPFRNLSADAELSSLAAGLSGQLITELKQVPELLVTDSRSSFAFKDSEAPLREIAGKLGVAHILDGTIASAGEGLRISVTLTRVADDEQLFSTTRDFNRKDIFAVQDEITGQVATALSVSLGVLQSRRPGMTRNVDAYTEYLSGLGYAQQFTAESLRSAIERFQRAIALDPKFLIARIALYFAYMNGSAVVSDDDASNWRARAAETLALVRTLAPDARGLEMIDAFTAMNGRKWSEVEAFLKSERARVLLDSDDIGLNAALGMFLLRVGRVREGITYLETARALAPLDMGIRYNLGTAYAASGDLAAARAEYDRGLELAPDSALIIGAELIRALEARDHERLEALLARYPRGPAIWRDLAALLDDREAAIAEIRRRFEAGVEDNALNTGLLAHWANYFGAQDLALDIMQTLPPDAPWLPLMIWDPGMAEQRKLPGFKALVQKLDLVSYWREYGWPDFCRPVGDDFVCQ